MQRQRRGHQHDGQQRECMDNARHRAAGAGAHVGHGAGDGAGGQNAAEERRHQLGDALGHQLLVGIVADMLRRHVVGHPGAQPRLEGAQQRDRDGGDHQQLDGGPAELGQRKPWQRLRDAAKARPDGVDRQLEHHHHRGGQRQRDGADRQARAQLGQPALPVMAGQAVKQARMEGVDGAQRKAGAAADGWDGIGHAGSWRGTGVWVLSPAAGRHGAGAQGSAVALTSAPHADPHPVDPAWSGHATVARRRCPQFPPVQPA
jgi:hypothetical protein